MTLPPDRILEIILDSVPDRDLPDMSSHRGSLLHELVSYVLVVQFGRHDSDVLGHDELVPKFWH